MFSSRYFNNTFFYPNYWFDNYNYTPPAVGPGTRFLPINWIPRWLDANYNPNNTFRNIYWSGLVYWLDDLSYKSSNYTYTGFYGAECMPRAGYTVGFFTNQFNSYIPTINLNLDYDYTSGGPVLQYTTLGGLLTENIAPSFFYNTYTKELYLKNLEIVNFATSMSSGVLDLSSFFEAAPRVKDSPIILVNFWGDQLVIDNNAENFDVTNNTIYLQFTGTLTVYYLCSTIRNQLIRSSAPITIGGVNYTLTPYSFENVWDDLSSMVGITRYYEETNTDLKIRCQTLAFATDPATRISAILGQSLLQIWNNQSALSWSGSGITGYSTNDPSYEYIVESPYFNNGLWLLSDIPSDQVYLTFQGAYVDVSNYTVTGNVLIPFTNQLLTAKRSDLAATYKTTKWQINKENYYIGIEPINCSPAAVYVTAARKVLVVPATQRVYNYSWDVENGALTGECVFS